ncbi:type II toxin-antitoxin system VapC family toxin [Egbenema bharatensis]|uniref:type II toxin-antitoxin system VapC family toxin n=1 Tax=Egbenema bharatensis TaxID=3463334 RepID=UPI003A85C4E4
MTLLFLDTSFIVALELADEQDHPATFRYWQTLSQMQPQFVTTSYVFDEIVTFFNSRHRHDRAVSVGNRLIESTLVRLIQVDEFLFLRGWQFFKTHTDKSYSLTDCISFLVIEQERIQTALTLDRHFVQAGFQKVP